jgi:hypothetical protein
MELVKKVKTLGEVSSRGKSALRTLMAASTPTIDLLVRESIQNSLDAAEDSTKCVNVDLHYSQFDPKKLRGILDETTCRRLEKVHPSMGTSLYIRDTGTKGLSGPKSHSEITQGQNEGNFLNLCFAIGSAQNQSGAGGSWGYGKTVFFRACVAPVLFYSRFRIGTGYSERLIFYLIEDADSPLSLTRTTISPPSTGFAWWGAGLNGDSISPCEDGDQISLILEQLGKLPRFVGNETGTLIFMPCLRSEKQLPVVPSDDCPPYWMPRNTPPSIEEFEEYTNVSIQRWYAPRLENKLFGCGSRPYLRSKVGSHHVGSDHFPILPLFKIIKLLYEIGSEMRVPQTNCTYTLEVCDIKVRECFIDNQSAGKFVAIKIPPLDPILENCPPNNNPSPLVQLGFFERGETKSPPPIVAMTRGPGMIVSYEHEGKWVPTVSDPDGNYIIGLFILRGEAELEGKFQHRTLEEEIRHNEPPAHDEWKSSCGVNGEAINLVERIQRSISNALLTRFFPKQPQNADERESTFSALIGERLLPHGFGNAASSLVRKNPTRPRGAKGQNTSVNVTHVDYKENGIVELELDIFCAKSNGVELLLGVGTEGSHLSPTEWHDEIGTHFPFRFVETNIIYIKEKNSRNKQSSLNHVEIVSKSIDITNHRILFNLSETRCSLRCKTLIQASTSDAALVVTAREIFKKQPF